MPLLDLHIHFPMHTRFPPRAEAEPFPLSKRAEYWAAQHFLNFHEGKPRASLDHVLAGAPGGIASALYNADDEFFRGPEPRAEAFDNLLAQMENVEREVRGRLAVVRNPAQVRRALESGERFLFHSVEGAFALGGDPDNVDVLASRGVAYVTIAHLFYRGVAACHNAVPFLPDFLFRSVLDSRHRRGLGLTELGFRIVDRLMARGILVDITHASDQAQEEVFGLARDHGNAPVIASHTGLRPLSNYGLNLSTANIRRIAESNGVIGIILSRYWLRQPAEQVFGDSGLGLVLRAIECVREITGSYDHIAIGTDLDGFISPIRECPNYSHTHALVAAIEARYPRVAEKILWRNAMDVLERGWRGVVTAEVQTKEKTYHPAA